MSRIYRDSLPCSSCRTRPRATYTDNGWKYVCACGNEFNDQREAGVEATGVEAESLAAKGFRLVHSDDGDSYYEGPENRLIWLWADGTFFVEDPFLGSRFSGTLDDYLESIQVTQEK